MHVARCCAMAEDSVALSTVLPPPAAEGDYDAICTTVMESARGRWVLQEYAKRNRHADTAQVLAAIERLETVIRGDRGKDIYQSFRSELIEMASVVAAARAELAETLPSSAPVAAASVRPDFPNVAAAA